LAVRCSELCDNDCGDVRPLSAVEHSTICHNLSSLVEFLDPDVGLLAQLYSRHCVNRFCTGRDAKLINQSINQNTFL